MFQVVQTLSNNLTELELKMESNILNKEICGRVKDIVCFNDEKYCMIDTIKDKKITGKLALKFNANFNKIISPNFDYRFTYREVFYL